ncbi:Phosphogluconate dehydratase, partial [hydrothermal vent metagenome]
MHPAIKQVTNQIRDRSQSMRAEYLAKIQTAHDAGPGRAQVSCGNFAHAIAASPTGDKLALHAPDSKNIGIVTAYNDMLSAHQPFATYPDIIKQAVRELGATAQVAGGVPAMCDGVTQGQPGMELSLFSRDVIAMATAICLSHNVFDGVVLLGVCDKIVPGLLIGALSFGHLPAVFIPAGPMPSGLPNQEKAKIRQLYAEGKVDRAALLQAEEQSYHSPGTCTFYGTANSNQMLMEFMGLHLPGSSFINPGEKLRGLLTAAAGQQAVKLAQSGTAALGQMIDEKAIVNGIVGLMATGGSTNLALHLVAIARAAGIRITWTDFAQISKITPLLARVYPNGLADINVFHAAGGMGFVIGELLAGGLLHADTQTIVGQGLHRYTEEPSLLDSKLVWQDGNKDSLNQDVLRP